VIDPVPVLAERGADALRWYMLSSGSPWTPKRVYVEGIDEATRQFLLTLWNIYSFFVTYANIDGWADTTAAAAPEHVLDRWITSRAHRTVRTATEALEQFDSVSATQVLAELVDDLSNWYVRRSRPRFWKSSDPAAHATLHRALLTLSQLLAPFCPFVADELFRNLAGTDESVHLADWPEHDEAAIDDALERKMTLARTLVSLGRAARADAKLGVRQPLPRAIALLAAGEVLRDDVAQEIKDELNVKELEVVDSLEGLLSYRVVPNFRTLGPRLGKLVPRVKETLENVDGGEVRRAFDEEGSFRIDVDGEEVKLEPGDVEIRAVQHVDLTLAQDGPHAIALDLTLDDDLRAEGIAREIIRVVNDRRKANGFALTDRVAVELFSTDRIVEAATRHAGAIKPEVLATSFEAHEELLESPPDATIDGEPVWLDVRRS
jgi:isoleucyl-tRNA synthetase